MDVQIIQITMWYTEQALCALFTENMSASHFPRVLLFEEHRHLVVSVQSPLSDDQWRGLCRRVTKHPHLRSGVVIDLRGVDVLDSFSASVLNKLYRALRFQGHEVVATGIPNPVSLSMTRRGLSLGNMRVAHDLQEAFGLLERPPPHPRSPPALPRTDH